MERSSSQLYVDGWDGIGIEWMVIIGRRYSKSTFGANNIIQILKTWLVYSRYMYEGESRSFLLMMVVAVEIENIGLEFGQVCRRS